MPNSHSEVDNTDRLFRDSPLGLYVHVPFCATTCDFCAFVQAKPDRDRIARYLRAIGNEWQREQAALLSPISTVFWGGGTPGLLPAKDLETLGRVFLREGKLNQVEEWTVEMAPATVTPSKLKTLKALGVTRISMGVQTFSDKTLKIMERYHSVSQVMRAWQWIQEAGFRSANIDMIIAFPGQSEAELLQDLEQAVSLAPDHISTYCLTFEEDTPLYAKLMQGIYKIDRDQEADLYKSTWVFLEDKGYRQYEISNFAKPGHQSIHNLNTWRMHQWLGIGPSAASQIHGIRRTNFHDFEGWEKQTKSDPAYQETIALTPGSLLADALIFGLRTNEGIHFNSIRERFGEQSLDPWKPLFQQLKDEGLAESTDSGFRLTLEGRLKADAVGVEILNCE